MVAEAEIALVTRELGWAPKALEAARATLESRGDRLNAAHARYLQIRRLLLIGRIAEAERLLAKLDPTPLLPASRTAHELLVAGIALRRLRTQEARMALDRAAFTARYAGIPALAAEVETARLVLSRPAARLIAGGSERPLLLGEVEALLTSKALVVDACRYNVRIDEEIVSLARRPVLFVVVRALAEAWPGDVARDMLIARAFGSRFVNESHRVRLRVGDRATAPTAAGPWPTSGRHRAAFQLAPHRAREVIVLARPEEEEHGAVLALLADGESWSTSALALALGTSQRTVQRALDSLAGEGKVQSFGRARARRWLTTPPLGFTTTLLLPSPIGG